MTEDWDQQLTVFGESLRIVPQLVQGVSGDRLHRIPAPGEWSAHVVVCHLVLDEMNTTAVLRLILTEDCPMLPNVRLCTSVSPDDLERVGHAPWRNGERITFRRYVATRSRHDRAHIEQIRSALSD